MKHSQGPFRQIEDIQQCLANDKKPVGLFIGAGCPTSIKVPGEDNVPLIPDINGITKDVCDLLAGCAECGPLLDRIKHQFEEDGQTDTNIEHYLSHIRSLRAVAGNVTVRDFTSAELDKLDDTICTHIVTIVNKTLPDTETPYHHLAAWIGAITRELPVEIFTTNYDLLMEQALEDLRVPYFDGFAGSRKPFFDIHAMEEDGAIPSRWTRLWKIHGSINWYQEPTKGVYRGSDQLVGEKRVIHPSHLKYEESRRMPYLAMIDRLRAFFKLPSSVFVLCGYSFRDQHINEVIVQGLRNNPAAICFALQFNKLADYPEALRLAKERTNLSLVANDGGVISGQELPWSEVEHEQLQEYDDSYIKWVPVDTNNPEGNHVPTFQMGDFKYLGEFLHELIGINRRWEVETHE